MGSNEDFIRERYHTLAARCRSRGLDVLPLPDDPAQAVNRVYELAAKLNHRDPLRVNYKRKPLVVEEAK